MRHVLSVEALERHGWALREREFATWGDELGEEGGDEDFATVPAPVTAWSNSERSLSSSESLPTKMPCASWSRTLESVWLCDFSFASMAPSISWTASQRTPAGGSGLSGASGG